MAALCKHSHQEQKHPSSVRQPDIAQGLLADLVDTQMRRNRAFWLYTHCLCLEAAGRLEPGGRAFATVQLELQEVCCCVLPCAHLSPCGS